MLQAELTGGTPRHAANRAWLLWLLSAGLQVGNFRDISCGSCGLDLTTLAALLTAPGCCAC